MNAGDMINRCFRHQNPDAYPEVTDGQAIREPDIPLVLRSAPSERIDYPTQHIPEEQDIGNPDAVPFTYQDSQAGAGADVSGY